MLAPGAPGGAPAAAAAPGGAAAAPAAPPTAAAIHSLPDSCLERVLCNLGAQIDRVRAAEVCGRWRDLSRRSRDVLPEVALDLQTPQAAASFFDAWLPSRAAPPRAVNLGICRSDTDGARWSDAVVPALLASASLCGGLEVLNVTVHTRHDVASPTRLAATPASLGRQLAPGGLPRLVCLHLVGEAVRADAALREGAPRLEFLSLLADSVHLEPGCLPRSLRELRIMSQGVQPGGVLHGGLPECVAECPLLEHFALTGRYTRGGPGGAELLAPLWRARSLRDLELREIETGEVAGTAALTALTRLSLRAADVLGEHVAAALPALAELRELDLRDCRLHHLDLDLLRWTPQLSRLRLGGNLPQLLLPVDEALLRPARPPPRAAAAGCALRELQLDAGALALAPAAAGALLRHAQLLESLHLVASEGNFPLTQPGTSAEEITAIGAALAALAAAPTLRAVDVRGDVVDVGRRRGMAVARGLVALARARPEVDLTFDTSESERGAGSGEDSD